VTLSLLFPPSLGPVTAGARAETLAHWLSQRLSRPVAVEVAESYGDLQRRVEGREVDLAWAPPTICARVIDSVPAIFAVVRRGAANFRAALVVRRGEITSLAQLRDKRAAWVDRHSAAGYQLPCALLRRHGYEPDDLLGRQTFVLGYSDAVRRVLEGKADVAPVFVHGETDEFVTMSLSTIVGARAAERLTALAFTDTTPADALVVVRDEHDGGVEVAAIARLGEIRESNPLLDAMDAEGLRRATVDDYAALRTT
jgi:phosphonate transport system substrate-binding protein